MRFLLFLITAMFFSDISIAKENNLCNKISINSIKGQSKAIYNIKNANDNQTRKVGLMNVKHMPENEGMMFSWNNHDKRYMWMKDTYISLDMVFIKNDIIIGIIKDTKPLSENILTVNARINQILELNAGQTERYNFKAGDIIKCIN